MIEIIIITYNRKQRLVGTLNSIKNSSLNEFKVTVLDNCSDDGTPEMLDEMIALGGLRLKRIRNEINIGACGNLMRAYEIASEDYTWILCDDDEYDFSSVREVIAAIINNYPDVIVVGSPLNVCAERLFPNKTEKLLRAKELCSTELPRLLSFLPSAIIKTKKLKSCDFSLGYKLSHTYFPQFFWISKLINADWSIYIVRRFLVIRSLIDHGLDSDFTHVNGYLSGISLILDKATVEHARNLYFRRGYIAYGEFIGKLIVREKISGSLSARNYINHFALVNLPRKVICLLMWFVFLFPTRALIALNSVTRRFLS
jgi:glycosyltransferase involved in cell wall biosynthesis